MAREPRRVAVMLELHWPYKWHSGVFAGTQQYAQEHGWHSVIDEYVDDSLAASSRRAPPYDGVIARVTKNLAERAARSHVPVVNIWLSGPAWNKLPGVFADFSAIGQMRAEHLLTRGFRRFAALTNNNERAHARDVKAFVAAVGEEGFSCLTTKIPLTFSQTLAHWRRTERNIAAWMDDWHPPIGVYVGSELIGRMVVQMCHNRGWRVPEDVAIITGWNEETYCEHLRPTLTSVEVGFERIGYEAARLLDRLMDERQKGKQIKGTAPEHILLPPQGLVVRESTDFLAVEDELVANALRFISANSHHPIGPDDVARAVGAETRTLQNRFRKFLDRPIATEIRRVRIERAKRELAQSKRRLSEIAREVGFGATMRMYEVFRRELGVTPSEYRKQRQRENGT